MTNRREGFDEYGNPIGRAFDLGGVDDERLRGERILLYKPDWNRYGEQFHWALVKKAIEDRNLVVDFVELPEHSTNSPITSAMLSSYSQIWLASFSQPTLNPAQVDLVCDFSRSGGGLFLLTDNEPLFADANLIARKLIGTHFSGNMLAEGILVPGGQLRPGVFLEHPLTQGLNQIYEGTSISTIAPVQNVKILAISHDGQNCMGCFERDRQRVVLDTGFTKFHNGWFTKTAGTARYLRNIAFWLARGARDLEYKSFTPGRESLATINPGGTSERYKYTLGQPTALTYILHWEGAATLGLVVQDPSGRIVYDSASTTAPLRFEAPTAAVGDWVCWVKGVSVPRPGFPYVLTLVQRKGGAVPPVGPVAQAPVVAPPTPVAAIAPAAPVAAAAGELPVYIVVDGSAQVSACAAALEAGVRRLAERLRARPARGSRTALGLFLADTRGRAAVPLTDVARFIAPSLRGQGSCGLGAALALLLDKLATRSAGPKPLVAVFLAGPPADDWAGPADRLCALASQGKTNVFVFGIGGYADGSVLGRLTAQQPLLLANAEPDAFQQTFDWLYDLVDVILSGIESGMAGQRKAVPAPPACLRIAT